MMEEENMLCTEFLDESNLQMSKGKEGKRSRSTNFTSQEEDVLLSLVEKYSHIIENKKTNAVTWQQKSEMWEKISVEFGSQCQSFRSAKNLRDKYENIKRKAKISISNDRNQRYKTGGGSYISKTCHNDERVNALLGTSATGLFNPNDCDVVEIQDEGNVIEIDLETQYEINEEKKIPADEKMDSYKPNTWSKWNPTKLKTKKSEKLNFEHNASSDKNHLVLAKQAAFFENEDRRAEERHQFQVNELRLKTELLELEITLKKMEIKKNS